MTTTAETEDLPAIESERGGASVPKPPGLVRSGTRFSLMLRISENRKRLDAIPPNSSHGDRKKLSAERSDHWRDGKGCNLLGLRPSQKAGIPTASMSHVVSPSTRQEPTIATIVPMSIDLCSSSMVVMTVVSVLSSIEGNVGHPWFRLFRIDQIHLRY